MSIITPWGGGGRDLGAGTNPTTTNCLAWYELNEASGTTVVDEVGALDLTNSSTLIGRAGVNGACYEGDGSVDFCNATGVLMSAYPCSMACWIKTSTASTSYFMSHGRNTSGDYWIALSINGTTGEIRTSIDDPTNYMVVSTSTGLNDGAWHHVVGTWVSATERYIYIDGSNDGGSAAETSATFPSSMTRTCLFALQRNTISNRLAGLLDTPSFWSKALSADEVTWLYNNGAGRSFGELT